MDQLDLPPLLDASDFAGPCGALDDDQRHAAPEGLGHVPPLLGASPPGAAEGADQLQLPPPLAVQEVGAVVGTKSVFTTPQSRAAYARAGLALKRATAKAKSATAAAANARSDLKIVSAVIPGAARLLGKTVSKKRYLAKTATNARDMCALAFVAFMKAKSKINVGLKHRRLIAAAARLVQDRQALGLQQLVAAAAQHRAQRLPGAQSSTIGVYTHEWDETRAFFRRFSRTKVNKGNGVWDQTIAQRGAWHTGLADGHGRNLHWSEQWLVAPRIVPGTAAKDLLPAIKSGLPSAFGNDGLAELEELSRSLDRTVFAPIGDKASANLRILQVWGNTFEK